MTSPDYKDLSTGFTQNVVRRIWNQVLKNGPTVESECRWYKAYRDKRDIPHVYSADFTAMTMEFIPADGKYSIDSILELIEKYKEYPRLNNLTFQSYRARIAEHLKYNTICNGQKLLNHLDQLDLPPTFCHGDLSIRNIVANVEGIKLIDPLYDDTRYGSYWLDYAKLAFSLKFYDGNVSGYNEVMARTGCPKVLIASECVRVATYNRRFNFISENLINEL